MATQSKKQWGGRFVKGTDPRTELFTESISFDKRLYAEDIVASIAHAQSLVAARVLTAGEAKKITVGLQAVAKKIAAGKVKFEIGLEDIHTHIENELKKAVGDVALKLHTGRSRNDQVITAVRLYLKNQIAQQIGAIQSLQGALVAQAEANRDVVLAGYTHLQPAQPVLLAHYLMAYFEMLQRDKRRIFEALSATDVLPLGSSALAGTPYNKINRQQLAKSLGFEKVSLNSMDAVSDRDFILDYLFAVSTLAVHLSRMAEDLIIWNTAEFEFVTMDDGFSTGSSLMPQKKNPDVAEIARGKAALLIGNLNSLLIMLKGLPMSYNRDLQDDKRILFQAVDTVNIMLPAFEGMLRTLSFNADKMEKTLDAGYSTATNLLDYLISKGVAFRTGHHLVGQIVLAAINAKQPLAQFPLSEFKKHSNLIEADVYEWFEVGRNKANLSLKMREIVGGTGPKTVATAVAQAKKRVKNID